MRKKRREEIVLDRAKTKRQLQAEQTKRHIFRAALHLLELQDFESITVRDIVREAGVSIGSFYNAYGSKLDVFYETFRVADEHFENDVRPMLTQDTSAEKILFFFREYARYNSVETPISLTKILYNPNNPYFRRSGDRGMLPILTQLVRQALEDGEFQSDKPAEEAAQFLMVCVRGVVYDWCLANGAYNLTQRVEEYVGYLLRVFQR